MHWRVKAADQRKHQSFASLDFVRGIHRWPVTGGFPSQKGSNAEYVSFDDVFMYVSSSVTSNGFHHNLISWGWTLKFIYRNFSKPTLLWKLKSTILCQSCVTIYEIKRLISNEMQLVILSYITYGWPSARLMLWENYDNSRSSVTSRYMYNTIRVMIWAIKRPWCLSQWFVCYTSTL